MAATIARSYWFVGDRTFPSGAVSPAEPGRGSTVDMRARSFRRTMLARLALLTLSFRARPPDRANASTDPTSAELEIPGGR